MKRISECERYFKKKLDKLNIPYEQQSPFVYHHFKSTMKKHRKFRVYTADFLIGNLVIEIKGWSSHDTFRVLKSFIYDYLKENDYELHIIKATHEDIDKWIDDNWFKLWIATREWKKHFKHWCDT